MKEVTIVHRPAPGKSSPIFNKASILEIGCKDASLL